MTHSIGERQEAHERCYDYTITKKLPIVIRAQLRNYKRLIQNLEKPFSLDFSEVMWQTALFAISQIEDAVFGYCHNDEIVFILKNDKKSVPWLGNNLQSVVSVSSSFLTDGFRQAKDMFGENLNLSGNVAFDVKVWALPDLPEAVDYLVHRQDSCIKNAINRACGYELESKVGRERASSLFKDKSYDDKEDMLLNYCGIDMYDYYPNSFIFGTAIYKVRKIQADESARNRWHVNTDIPNFIDDKSFVSAILANGVDVFRASDLSNIIDSEDL
jgi:tRNA(His) 5'-end guanylyltransferase